MLGVLAVADLRVSEVIGCYADEVGFIAYYGSYSQGTAGPGSDLDIFYIPAEGKRPPVGRAVLIAGLLFDFWPIRWDTCAGTCLCLVPRGRVGPAVRGRVGCPRRTRFTADQEGRSHEQQAGHQQG